MTASDPLGRSFWAVFTASSISNLGNGVTYAAIPLLAVSATRDPRLVAAVSVASYLPALLLGLHSGAFVDRSDRKAIMWRTDVVRAAVVGSLAVLVAAGHRGIATLIVVALALGAADILFENAASAIVPMLVPARDSLERANSWLLGGQTVSGQFLGLPLGGALFVVAAAAPFGVDAVTFLVAAFLVRSMPGRYATDRGSVVASSWQDVREGAGWLWRHQVLRTLALLLMVLNGAVAAGEAILVLYAVQVLRLGQFGYSLLLALFAVGALAGTVLATRLGRWLGRTHVIQLSLALLVAALLTPGLTSSLPAICAALLAIGLGATLWNVITISLRQAVVPPHLLGRVTSAYRVVGLGSMPLGAALGGLTAHGYGLRAPWFAAAATLALAALVALPFVHIDDVAVVG